MIEAQDRLPDEWFSDEELDKTATDILGSVRLGVSGHAVLYHLYKDGIDTGIVMLLGVESVTDGCTAINRMWGNAGIHAEIGEFCEVSSITVGYTLNAIEIVLDKWKYEGKLTLPGANRLYKYCKWFDNLVK